MKVILTHEVTNLGTAGDVVDVKDGYARNFLFRRGLATAWTKGGQKQVDAIAKGREVREVKSLEEAKSIKGNLESKAVTVTAHAGTGGRLFGAVSTADIADAVKWVGRCGECQAWGSVSEVGAVTVRTTAATAVERPAVPIGEVDARRAVARPTGV